jgi:hypothetical protein
MRYAIAVLACAGLIGVPVAHADPDDSDNPGTTDEICGAFNMGIAPGDIPGRLGQNDKRYNYWQAQRDTRDAIIGGECG